MQLVSPVGGQEQHVEGPQAPGQVVDQLPGGGVRPMEILEDDQQAALPRQLPEEDDDGLEEPELGLRGISRPVIGAAQLWEELGELGRRRSDLLPEMVGVDGEQVVPDCFQEGQVRERDLGLAAAAGDDRAAQPPRAGAQLGGEPGLSHPGLTAEDNDSSLAAQGRQQRVLQLRELLLPADDDGAERREHGHRGQWWPKYGD